MFHVEQGRALALGLTLWQFWRRRASGKVKFRFDWCYLRQNTCKSYQCQVFFAGEGKIFSQTCSLRARPRAHPGSIRVNARDVKDYLRQ